MSFRSILVVLFGAIGDVTQALPVAVRIKRSAPDCRVSWAIEPPSRALVENHPAIDRVVVFDRPRGFAGYRAFLSELRKEEYDVVLDLQRHFKSGVTSMLSRGKRRIGFHRRNAKEFNWVLNNDSIAAVPNLTPKIMQYQKFCEVLGLQEISPLEYGLFPTEQEREKISALMAAETARLEVSEHAGYVPFVIGASWTTRVWPARSFAGAAEALWSDFRLLPVLVGGKTEAAAASEICSSANTPLVNIVQKTNLRELAAVFEQSRFVIGCDSGPSHIAAACGKKVISLWGPTSPARSAPYRSEDFALQSAIGCSPCYRRSCPGLDTICMSSIPPEAVVARVREVLDHAR